MIRFENRFDEYAYRVATRDLAATVTELKEGQWVTINDDGELVVSDGTKKSFLTTTSKRTGRDNISMSGKATYLHGNYELSVDQFDAEGTYAGMTPLKVTTGGILAPLELPADAAIPVAAWSVGAPVGGFLRIIV